MFNIFVNNNIRPVTKYTCIKLFFLIFSFIVICASLEFEDEDDIHVVRGNIYHPELVYYNKFKCELCFDYF